MLQALRSLFQRYMRGDDPLALGDQVFTRFKAFEGMVLPGFHHDFAGCMISAKFDGAQANPDAVYVYCPKPSVNEEYFEWIDLLSTVEAAHSTYVVAEIGAGYGRWAARSVLMAHQRGLKAKAILVEAEPVHARWAREHMRTNGITDFKVIEAAAGRSRSKTTFAVRMPDEASQNHARDWYGQAIFPGDGKITNETYESKALLDVDGWSAIEVEVLSLAEMLESVDEIDFLDMDVQNAEGEVIEGGAEVLNHKVKFIHVGTHSQEVENRIRHVMRGLGWTPIWDFPCAASGHPTPFGPVDFQDGVQSWANPKFSTRLRKR